MADFDDVDEMDFLPEDMQLAASSAHGFQLPTELQREQIHQKIKRFYCLYPVYYEASRSLSRGRIVPAQLAVKGVTVWHIAEAIKKLGLPCVVEEAKRHPRDAFNAGRVRTTLKENGYILSKEVKSRRQLHNEIAMLIPSVSEKVEIFMEQRKQQELEEMKRMREMMPQGMASMMNPMADMMSSMGLEDTPSKKGESSGGGEGKTADKKKGKKKR